MKQFNTKMLKKRKKKKKTKKKTHTHTENRCAPRNRSRFSGFVARHAKVRLCAALNNRTNRRDSATFVYCVHRLISTELHLSVFGTETISSDKKDNK